MDTPLNASASSAGAVFSNSIFEVPQFQREYSWTAKEEVTEFWTDLSGSISSEVYFLGLLILTNENDRGNYVFNLAGNRCYRKSDRPVLFRIKRIALPSSRLKWKKSALRLFSRGVWVIRTRVCLIAAPLAMHFWRCKNYRAAALEHIYAFPLHRLQFVNPLT